MKQHGKHRHECNNAQVILFQSHARRSWPQELVDATTDDCSQHSRKTLNTVLRTGSIKKKDKPGENLSGTSVA